MVADDFDPGHHGLDLVPGPRVAEAKCVQRLELILEPGRVGFGRQSQGEGGLGAAIAQVEAAPRVDPRAREALCAQDRLPTLLELREHRLDLRQ